MQNRKLLETTDVIIAIAQENVSWILCELLQQRCQI